MLVAFRFDSGVNTGMGHLMRCLTLADALRRRRAKIMFLCRSDTAKALKHYLPDANVHIISGHQDAARCRTILTPLPHKPDWLVVDHYKLDKTWETQMRPLAHRIMAIDDIGRAHDCDLLLDSNIAAEEKHYATQGRRLLGPQYALLRRSISTVKYAAKTPRIFLCFGGSDPHKLTRWAAEALDKNIPVDIVAGYSYPGKKSLEALCKKRPHWRLFIDHPSPEKLMAKATLAIGAGGTMTWERCAIGLPSIVISIAENQRPACEALAARGVIDYLGHYNEVNVAALRKAVNKLLADTKARGKMSAASKALVNLRGADLVAKIMSEL